jgi:hypothetical protein
VEIVKIPTCFVKWLWNLPSPGWRKKLTIKEGLLLGVESSTVLARFGELEGE